MNSTLEQQNQKKLNSMFIPALNNLSEEQVLIQKTAREFAKNDLLEGAIKRDETKEWPKEQVE